MNANGREEAVRWVIDSYGYVPVDSVIDRLNQMLDGLLDPDGDPDEEDYEESLVAYLGRQLTETEVFELRRIWFWVSGNLYGEE